MVGKDESRDADEAKLMGMSMSSNVDSSTIKAFQSYGGGLSDTASLYFREYIPYTPYVNLFQSKDTFAQAFKVASMLVENGHLKNINLNKFIKIVKEIEGEL